MAKAPILPDDPAMRCEALKLADRIAPFYRLLGMKVDEVKEGYAKLSMPFREDLTQPLGMMHGGALASLADSAVAIALLTVSGPKSKVVTVELKINYFEPVRDGILVAECRVVFKGSKIAYGEVDLRESGRLVARATSTYMIS